MTYTARNYFRSLTMALLVSAPLALAEDSPNNTALSPSAASELLFQLETLQVEVQTLRGIIEQQQHELSKMKGIQKDRYIDLDKRISLVMSRMSDVVYSSQGSGVQQEALVDSTSTNLESSSTATSNIVAVGTEQKTSNDVVDTGPVVIQPTTPEIKDAYKASYDLIRSKEYEKAAEAFAKFVKDHPNSDLTGNGYYWLGQLKLVLGDPENALAQFDTVVNKFPGHNKEPDAVYKLGLVNDQLDNKIAAKRHLIDVIERFPVSDAAKLAKKYLSSMK